MTVEGRADGAVDRALEEHGSRREVCLRVPHFATAPLAVLGSDALCTIASSVAERARALHGLLVRTPPIELPAPAIVAVWGKRAEDDAAARWFRSLFVEGSALTPHLRALARRTTAPRQHPDRPRGTDVGLQARARRMAP